MKREKFQLHTCFCENQHLLMAGEICDICMGINDYSYELSKVLPEERFDENYFEALEHYFEHQATAA